MINLSAIAMVILHILKTLDQFSLERASRGVHKLLGTGEVPTSLAAIVLAEADVSSVFVGRSA